MAAAAITFLWTTAATSLRAKDVSRSGTEVVPCFVLSLLLFEVFPFSCLFLFLSFLKGMCKASSQSSAAFLLILVMLQIQDHRSKDTPKKHVF